MRNTKLNPFEHIAINIMKVKKAEEIAKNTVMTVVKVPQHIGRTILSVPKTISKITNKKKKNEKDQPPKFADRLEFINQEILEGQTTRRIVRESHAECLKEINDHLTLFLKDSSDSDSDDTSANTCNHTYEEWIAELHPDNAEYADGSIDHRFYVEDSDHRQLWNIYMEALGFVKQIVPAKSVQPSYNRSTH